MRKTFLHLAILFPLALAAQRDYTKLVNPFIGTGGHGHTYPGASMPFGMMQLSPDTRMADWDGSSGYHYSDSVIYGFSHTHLSGTGIPDYCDLLFMPFSGKVEWDKKDYRSGFSHSREKASPGYYEVMLDKHKIKAQLTTSYRSGMHQYSFPSSAKDGGILIDLQHRDEVLETHIEKVSATEIRGYRRSRSWAQNQVVYFYIKLEQPLKKFILHSDNKIIKATKATGKNIKAALRFNIASLKTIRAKVGISGVSMEGARKNLDSEIKGWNFDQVRNSAKLAWNKELNKIEVKGGTIDQQVAFYTALYHTMLAPNIYQDADGKYLGTDGKVHQANGFTNYSVFSLWDAYRAYHPLMTIINRKRTTDWINTFLNQYKNGGMLPVWELGANETFCMIGYHSVPVIWDAYQKGIRGFDAKLALQAMRSYAESDRFGLNYYRQDSYLSNEKEHESVSKTLEYAYDDWAIAQYARAIGNKLVHRVYSERAQYYKNLFDPATKHMRGKMQASWYKPFDPAEINNFYTEGNAWHYSFAAPQDIETLIQLQGGKEGFGNRLEELFTTSSKLTGREQADVTGLIGQYAHGNEPSHHMAYLFNYIGKPWRTQELVHQINTEFYKNSPDGLIGNEDCGQMSAWFVMSAIGFYPVCPGNGDYVIGTPLFDEVRINLENGKNFTIKANRQSPQSKYIQQANLNGKPHTKSWLLHEAIAKGGNISFKLTDKANKNWGVADEDLPKSKIETQPIVPVPYFDIESNKFREKTTVTLNALDKEAQIYYLLIQPNIRSFYVPYEGPFEITESAQISTYAQKGDMKSSVASQNFYRIPGDKKITVLSQVHPMYTAGGAEALVDGIMGTTNWRAGDWQSYFNTDLEAIIELNESKPISYLGAHVLQDVSPWIVYPKELIFYASEDGISYREVARVLNTVAAERGAVQMQELGKEVNSTARFIKIKAVNAGQLPAWHESAGQPTHLFIDEIIIR